MDHAYAMIRKAAQLTQVEVAKRLGVGQAAVSRMESRGDMLLPTLYDYLTATGADTASIVVTVHGRRIEWTSDRFAGAPKPQLIDTRPAPRNRRVPRPDRRPPTGEC
jgi:transcriptional regulator with XRE-family HTH domain